VVEKKRVIGKMVDQGGGAVQGLLTLQKESGHGGSIKTFSCSQCRYNNYQLENTQSCK
jgi:hypothetical protein